MIPVKDKAAQGFAPITFFIILVNIAMFIEELRLGSALFDNYGISPAMIYNYLTKGTDNFLLLHRNIFISAFMHGGYIHFCGNMLFLYVFAPAVERRLGWMRFIVFFVFAVFVSFYCHALFNAHSKVIVVGASGAIAAVMGIYLVFFPKARIVSILPIFFIIEITEIPAMLFMLGWFLLQGLNGYLTLGTQTSIAWFAHIGGFVFGFLIGIYYRFFS